LDSDDQQIRKNGEVDIGGGENLRGALGAIAVNEALNVAIAGCLRGGTSQDIIDRPVRSAMGGHVENRVAVTKILALVGGSLGEQLHNLAAHFLALDFEERLVHEVRVITV